MQEQLECRTFSNDAFRYVDIYSGNLFALKNIKLASDNGPKSKSF